MLTNNTANAVRAMVCLERLPGSLNGCRGSAERTVAAGDRVQFSLPANADGDGPDGVVVVRGDGALRCGATGGGPGGYRAFVKVRGGTAPSDCVYRRQLPLAR